MARLAKEVGLVGSGDVDQVNQFVIPAFGCKYVFAILSERRNIEAAQPALDPYLEHRLLVRTQ
jgi:hypothetical protein